MRRYESLGVLVLWVFVVAGVSCKKEAPPAPREVPKSSDAGTEGNSGLDVGPASELLFTFLGADGRFRTVGRVEDIPPAARAVVRVLNPKEPPEKRSPLVLIADLTHKRPDGRYPTRLVERDVFESMACALLPPGEGSPFSGKPGVPGQGVVQPPSHVKANPDGGASALTRLPPGPKPGTASDVILYGTKWCGACAKAREYLRQRGIPYIEKDVEEDVAAQEELRAKARRAGIRPDRVPVIDVRGTLLVGFDPRRLEAVLGTPI